MVEAINGGGKVQLEESGGEVDLARGQRMRSNPCDDFMSLPLDENIFELGFAIRGPSDTEFEGGIYHGRIQLLADYPFMPPSFMLLTNQGVVSECVEETMMTHSVGDNNDVSEKTMMEEENGCQKKEEDEMNNQQVLKTMIGDENGRTVIVPVQGVLPYVTSGVIRGSTANPVVRNLQKIP